MSYADRINHLIHSLEEKAQLGIDPEIHLKGRVPTNATSEFLINKEQGDWAERLICSAINDQSARWMAVPYGRQDSLAAGDEGFSDFYQQYQDELNSIGKKPDLLIFDRSDFESAAPDISEPDVVRRAVAALEVRSSAFLEKKYRVFMETRQCEALRCCQEIQGQLLKEPLSSVLKEKSPPIFDLVASATPETFRDVTFRRMNWSSSPELREVTRLLRKLWEHIKVLQIRDFLSITPKVEDIALVNRWIRIYGVPHFYVQVFFDGAFAIPFEQILTIPTRSKEEDYDFRLEKDVKNQGKSTIKINVALAQSLVEDVEIPQHSSRMKELERGRLLFFVTFSGESGVLNDSILSELINGSRSP